MSHDESSDITANITAGDLTYKPGWIRMSIHPVMTDEEVDFILNAIKQVHDHFEEWSEAYEYNVHTNEFIFKGNGVEIDVDNWFL